MLPKHPTQFHDFTPYSNQLRRSNRPHRPRKLDAQSNPSVVKTSLSFLVFGRALPFRLLLTLAGALLLMTAFAQGANATGLIAYYNFEGAATSPFPVNATSHAPAFFNGSDPQHTSTLVGTNLSPSSLSLEAGLPFNQIGANTTGLGFHRTGLFNMARLDMPLLSSQGFQDMTLSFAISNNGNGYTSATVYYSTDGGGQFTQFGTTIIPSIPGFVPSFNVPAAANNAQNLVLRIEFANGQSNGADLQNVIDNIQVNGTNPQTATVGQIIISEFRVRGPNGANDEFIELYNATGAAHTVAAAIGTGYGVAASDGVTRCSIPNGTVIPNRGHYLCINSVGYSLGAYPAGNGTTATGDATYTTDIADNAGIAIFNNDTGGASYSLPNRLDAVGSTSEANTLYKEGTGYPALTPFSIDYAFYRDNCGKSGSITTFGVCPTSTPKDTNNNAADFIFVDTNGTSAGAGQRLGAPGPENLSSPIQRNASFTVDFLDPCAAGASPPNRVRDFTSDPPNNSTFGTLDIRRTVVNNTGGNVTRLRWRVIDITTFPAPSGIADLRPRTSTAVVVTVDRPPCGSGTSNVTVQGTTLEQPPSQPNGGGFNSSLSSGTVTLATPIANGASVDVRFLLGIQQTGSFKFFINVETLP